jgi:hypothetical protein
MLIQRTNAAAAEKVPGVTLLLRCIKPQQAIALLT